MSPRAARRPAKLAGAALLFAALGDPTRLEILARLGAGGPLSITRLTEGASVSRQAVTKHLQVLAEVGLARGTRVGRDHVWQVEPARLEEARRWLDEVAGQWDDALSRLKSSLEGGS